MHYPFSALVGQQSLKTALVLNAVYPAIGGVLIRGEKGTAKSTAARALAELLPPLRIVPGCPFNCDPADVWKECPHCAALDTREAIESGVPFVDLPIGATEDRVLGTLDFEQALREGRRAFHPGLLAAAHRGILYIDEVNLLPDHLVDVLLDAAALGANTVQREGVALTHPARFVLIGTMNPEEGDLRPQLLDRFGLMVEVTGPRDPEARAEIVRRRLAYEADPAAFATRWSGEQTTLRAQIAAARALLPEVILDDSILKAITHLCCEFEVDGLRADIVLHKTARALAAFEARRAATLDDVRRAAEWVLPHRRHRRSGETPRFDRDRLNNFFDPKPPERGENGASEQEGDGDGAAAADSEQPRADEVFAPTAPRGAPRIEVETKRSVTGKGQRNPTMQGERGRYVRAVADGAPTSGLALDATIRAAALRGARNEEGKLEVAACDLHRKERAGRTGTLMLFVVDASGSMAARRRMEAVKGTAIDLLRDAYQRRDEVGVIVFRGPAAELLLPPTRSVEHAEQALRVLPTGGRTPLAHALVLARQVLTQRQRSDLPVLLVLLSDGKANVPLSDRAGDPWNQALAAATELATERVAILVLDTDAGFIRTGRAQELAQALAAEYHLLEDLETGTLTVKVRQMQ